MISNIENVLVLISWFSVWILLILFQVVIPLSLQRRVEGLLQEHLDRTLLKSEKADPTLSELDTKNHVENANTDENGDSFLDASVMEKVLQRQSLRMRNMQRTWQVSCFFIFKTSFSACMYIQAAHNVCFCTFVDKLVHLSYVYIGLHDQFGFLCFLSVFRSSYRRIFFHLENLKMFYFVVAHFECSALTAPCCCYMLVFCFIIVYSFPFPRSQFEPNDEILFEICFYNECI